MITVNTADQKRFFAHKDLVYVESLDRCARFCLRDGSVVVSRKLRNSFERDVAPLLRGGSFARCHQSFFVNLGYITGLSRQTVLLQSGRELPVSKKYHQPFLDAYAAYLAQSETEVASDMFACGRVLEQLDVGFASYSVMPDGRVLLRYVNAVPCRRYGMTTAELLALFSHQDAMSTLDAADRPRVWALLCQAVETGVSVTTHYSYTVCGTRYAACVHITPRREAGQPMLDLCYFFETPHSFPLDETVTEKEGIT